ncbi:MAG: hypothetical protein H6700_10740 [Myxococcales bacterium]|nr:hypothetical protein [Myxococcales bacterium]
MSQRRPTSLPLAAAAAAVWLVAACPTSDPPAPSPVADAGGRDSIFPCSPECPEGYACEDGECVPACSPVCPEGTRCDGGVCVSAVVDGPGPDALRNPCGGFGEIAGLPGTPCGPCETGRWLCETEDVVVCVDPEGLNACGTCGELPGIPGGECGDAERWACAPDGALICVDWFDANPCLGTTTLTPPPGRACGACDAGYAACAGNNGTECVEPSDPAPCECDPATSPPILCGSETGICTRGLRFCEAGGRYGSCVEVDRAGPCVDGVCGEGETCLRERLGPFESLDDRCVTGDEPECDRATCVLLDVGRVCTDDEACSATQSCAGGRCRALVTWPIAELCNGVDDDCDGRIDNDERRTTICGACPFNMMLVTNEAREFGRRRICIDIYEASRPDATLEDAGSNERYSASNWDRMPWTGLTANEAVDACAGAGFNAQIPGGVPEKRLCVEDEWSLACNVLDEPYPYGETFEAGRCNDADAGLGGLAPTTSFEGCSHLVPGGRFPNYDFVGNAAEWVRGDEGAVVAGGSYRSRGAAALSCDSFAAGPARPGAETGFRCCAATATVTNFGDEE